MEEEKVDVCSLTESDDIPVLRSDDIPVSSNRKVELIEVPDFLEPFKYNWIRKLVFRSLKINKQGKPGPLADVCYISPSGRKFWNSKRLREFLSHSHKNGLKSCHFTFSPRPIGLNDETKEILDYSRQTIAYSNAECFEPPDLTPNFNPQLSSNFNVDTNSDLNNDFHSDFTSEMTSGLTCKIIKKRPIQKIIRKKSINLTSRKVQKRKGELKVKAPRRKRTKTDLSDSSLNNSISSTITNSVIQSEKYGKYFSPSNSMQAVIDYHKSLQSIFNRLEIKDLLKLRRVCSTWKDIADKPSFWTKVSADGLRITDWIAFSRFLETHKTKYLNLKGVIDVENIDWDIAASAIANTSITELEINGSSAEIAEKICHKCRKLYSLNFTLLNNVTINLNNMDKMHQHDDGEAMQVSYDCVNGINLEGDIAPLLSLTNLTHLTLKTLKNLTTLKLCDGISLSSTSNQNARYLKLERLETRALISFNIVEGISGLTKLEHLELIDFEVEENFDEHLKKCTYLKSLMLIPAYNVATANRTILKAILSLKEHLKYLIWGVHAHQLRKSKTLLWRQTDFHRDVEFIPIIEPVPFLHLLDSNISVQHKQERNENQTADSIIYSIKMLQVMQLEKLIRLAMPSTSVSILKTEKFRPADVPDVKEPKFFTVYT